jgi:hypothetical protein
MTERFAARVAEIDRRIRAINPEIAAYITHEQGPGDEARWQRDGRWAMLTLHDGSPRRLQLTSHTGTDQHPDALEIGLDDADVVDMIAQPVTALLAGTV